MFDPNAPARPDDIPTSITELVYKAQPATINVRFILGGLSQNDVAEVLAHFWPAIEEHVRQQVAADLESNLSSDPGVSAEINQLWERAGRIALSGDRNHR